MKIPRATKETEDEILKEINYSRKQLTLDLQALKDWMKDEKHLPEIRMKESEEFLLQYLVGAKGSLEKAKRKIDAYYTFRSVSPIFQTRDNIELQKQAAVTQFVLALPQLLPDGCPATLLGARDADVNLYDPVNTTRRIFLSGEYILRHCGIIRAQYFLIDATGFTTTHALRTTPTLLRSIVAFIQEAAPVRMKKCVVFNAPVYAETLINKFVRPFMKEKLKKRLIVSSEPIEKVFDYVDYLPEDYGGKNPLSAKLAEEWESTLMNWHYLPHLEERVDESRRSRKTGEYDHYFGLHGSIKALVID